MTERYSFSLTTFSPSGKLVQIEYALQAVAAGAPSVGIKAKNGIVIAVEKKQRSPLYENNTVNKIECVNSRIGMVYSGMGPDFRLLVRKARKLAVQYEFTYHETIPVSQLVQKLAAVMQEYTQSGGVRPFGVSLLIAGFDEDQPYLYQCDPSGAYFAWRATAMGKNYINSKTFLEKRYNEDLEIDDAVHTAILTLKFIQDEHSGFGSLIIVSIMVLVRGTFFKYSDLITRESFDGQMTEDNIEIGIANADGFRPLEPSEIKDYLAAIQ